jgi:hypothetical protein
MRNKELSLPSQSYLYECFTYDYETGKLYWRDRPEQHFKTRQIFKMWNACFAHKEIGVNSKESYLSVCVDKQPYMLHRIIWRLVTGDDLIGFEIDHINGDKKDNRIENLRKATRNQNEHNKKLARNNTSGYKGVCFETRTGKWMAYVKHNSISYQLGRFNTKDAALAVVVKKRNELHKQFKNHGFN